METTPEVKETKAQRAERLKREKNPWEHLDEIRAFAKGGWDSIPPEWRNSYFRWWGAYTQGDGLGVTGGKGGEGNAVPYFMVRVKVPTGKLHSHQLRTIADLSEKHARGITDITVRQNFQFHWVAIESLPEMLETLWVHGLTTVGACGDVTRNITGCPLAGVDAEELLDASPYVAEAAQMLYGNPDYYNFPRKYKISISGCKSWCNYPEINDIGMTAVKRTIRGREETGFSVRVGGGLSTEPFLAARLDAFVKPDQVIPVIRGISDIFRDSEILRQDRGKARLKYLFLKFGWTAESFLEELQNRIGFKLEPGAEEEMPDDVFRDHVGIHRQKQDGYSYVGASVLRGRISPAQMRAAAGLADQYASGELRTTIMQNIAVINVPDRHAETVAAGLAAADLPVSGSPFWRGGVACTGTEFCKLAITETKGFLRWLVGQLDERLPGFDEHLKIHVTGCSNSCGQHWIADIGLEGKKVKIDGKMVDAYYFSLGGALGLNAALNRRVGYRCASTEVPDAIERLLRTFGETRRNGENLRQFFGRHSDEELKTILSGA